MRSRSFLVLLVLLFVCAPVMAATVTMEANGNGFVTVTVTSESAVNIVALALDIEVDSGAVVTDVWIDTPCFDIFPDAGYDLGAGYTYGAGTAVCFPNVPGQTILPAANFTLCVGCLNGPATPGADGAATVQFTLGFDTSIDTVCVSENAIRGGIVLTDGTGEDITNGTDGVVCEPVVCSTCEQCVSSTAPFYADWVMFGEPMCWCYAAQCLGDADGLTEGNAITGIKKVFNGDLTLFLAGYGVKEAPKGPGILSIANGICADFDHAQEGNPITGFKRVFNADLTLFLASYGIKEAPKGPGIGDCAGPDYNFLY